MSELKVNMDLITNAGANGDVASLLAQQGKLDVGYRTR